MSEEKKSVAVPAFVENLDCLPIYLGFDKLESSYWFYALKEGTARFLKYVNYFHWDRGPQGILKLVTLPVEIGEELNHFLQGQVSYEFIKKRSNSRNESVRKCYRLPSEVVELDGARTTVQQVCRSADVGRVDFGSTTAGGQDASDASTRGRQRGCGSAESSMYPTEPDHDGTELVSKPVENDKKPLVVDSLPELPKPKLRRKSKKAQEALESQVVETPPAEIKTANENRSGRMELGRLDLLSEPGVAKRRGRPPKVKP